MLKVIARRLKALHRDEQGADMVEYILIIAAIVLPVLAIIIWFKDEIASWAAEKWDQVRSDEGSDPHDQ